MLSRTMSIGLSGLNAQSAAMATISHNLANAQTVGFKASEVLFRDMVGNDRYGVDATGIGARAAERLLADRQGQFQQTSMGTNAAINGAGFFVVQDLAQSPAARGFELTRAGDFVPNIDGYLVNSAGRALTGIRLNGNAEPGMANLATSSLEPVNVGGLGLFQRPTQAITVSGILPSNAPIPVPLAANSGSTARVEVIDQTGYTDATGMPQSRVAQLDLRFVKTATDPVTGTTTWAAYNAGARYKNDGALVGPNDPSDPATWGAPLATFQTDYQGYLTGGAAGTDATFPLTLGAGFSPMTVTIGQYGSGYGLTALASSTQTALSASQDGVARHTLKSVGINENGYVQADFAGGQQVLLYKLVNGTVRNPNELRSISGTSFLVTEESGPLVLKQFGHTPTLAAPDRETYSGSDILSTALEISTTNMEEQFSKMIVSQRTYSAASKVIGAGDDMLKTCLTLKA